MVECILAIEQLQVKGCCCLSVDLEALVGRSHNQCTLPSDIALIVFNEDSRRIYQFRNSLVDHIDSAVVHK